MESRRHGSCFPPYIGGPAALLKLEQYGSYFELRCSVRVVTLAWDMYESKRLALEQREGDWVYMPRHLLHWWVPHARLPLPVPTRAYIRGCDSKSRSMEGRALLPVLLLLMCVSAACP